MQLSLDLSQIGHTTRLPNIIQPKESTAYIAVSGCVLDHIVVTKDLSGIEKLFFLLANSLSLINCKSSRQRTVALSAESWAKRLDCSKTRVFSLQQSLSDKGYFIITRDKNKHNQNKRNLICPTLPDSVFKELCKAPDRAGQEHLYFVPTSESKLEYLDRTKLFILLGYQVLKDISACEHLGPFHKLVWLDFYVTCYKSHMANFGTPSDIEVTNAGFSFITSYKQLEDRFNCDKRLLSEALIDLEEIGLIKRVHFYVKKDCDDQDRQDKSLWKISLLSSEQLKNNQGNGESNTNFPFPGSTRSLNPINFSSKLLPIRSNTQGSLASRSEANCTKNKEHVVDSTSRIELDYGSIESKPETRAELKPKINSTHERYIENIVAELGQSDEQETNIVDTDIDTQAITDLKADKSQGFRDIRNMDPDFRSSTLYLTKDLRINNFKSNLEVVDKIESSKNEQSFRNEYISFSKNTSQCFESLKRLNQYDVGGEDRGYNEHRGVSRGVKKLDRNIPDASEFNVCTSLIKDKLKLLSAEKAEKARKFAYALVSKKITKGYASTLSKHELAKQFIFHATSWKPTKVGRGASDDKLVDVTLSVAWKAAVKGSWQEPLEWAKAKALQYEFLAYKRKFKESGVFSHDLPSLEVMVNNLLGSNYSLKNIISKEVNVEVNLPKDIKETHQAKATREIDLGKGQGESTAECTETPAGAKTNESSELVQVWKAAKEIPEVQETQEVLEENQTTRITSIFIEQGAARIILQSGTGSKREREASSRYRFIVPDTGRVGGPGSHEQKEAFQSEPPFETDYHDLQTNKLAAAAGDGNVSGNLLQHQAYVIGEANIAHGINPQEKNEEIKGNVADEDINNDNYQKFMTQLKFLKTSDNDEVRITSSKVRSDLSQDLDYLKENNDKTAENGALPLGHVLDELTTNNHNLESEFKLWDGQSTLHNQDDLHTKYGQYINKDFVNIDQALSGILKNLKKGN